MNDAQMGGILAFIFGVIFVTALLAIVVFIPNPSDKQFEVIRIILALAAGGVAAMIPGFLNLKLGLGTNLANSCWRSARRLRSRVFLFSGTLGFTPTPRSEKHLSENHREQLFDGHWRP
jgi:hypothetical protein